MSQRSRAVSEYPDLRLIIGLARNVRNIADLRRMDHQEVVEGRASLTKRMSSGLIARDASHTKREDSPLKPGETFAERHDGLRLEDTYLKVNNAGHQYSTRLFWATQMLLAAQVKELDYDDVESDGSWLAYEVAAVLNQRFARERYGVTITLATPAVASFAHLPTCILGVYERPLAADVA